MGTYEWLKVVFDSSDMAIARHKIILDENGKPIDYLFLEVNRAFEKMTGLKREEILHKSALTILPVLKSDDFNWVSFFGKVALKRNTSSSFEKYSLLFKKWYRIEVISDEKFYFTTIFHDIGHEKELYELKKESQNKYQKIFEMSNDGLFLHDVTGQIIDVNPKATELTGYSKEQLMNMNIKQLSLEKGKVMTKESIEKIKKTGQVVTENQIIDRTGKIIDVSINGSFFDKTNGIILGAVRDISEIKKKELDLKNIIEGTRAGTWQWDVQKDIQIVNDHWAQMLGYTVDELSPLTTEKWQSLMHPEDLKKLEGYLDQHFVGEIEQFECECRFKHKNGNWVWVLSRGRALEWTPDGKPGIMFGTHLDITRLKKTENEMIRLSEFQRILMNMASKYINLPYSDVDQAKQTSLKEVGDFVEADRAYIFEFYWDKKTTSNTYEWCRDGIEPQKEHLQEIPMDAVPKWVDLNVKGQMVDIKDVKLLNKKDPARLFLEPQGIKSLLAIPIMNGTHCEGFVGFDSVKQKKVYSEREKSLLKFFSQILLNIDTRAKLEENLIKETKKALAANRAKSDFLANMSHEIRTPLNGVIGFCSVLMDTELTEAQKEYTDTIMSSGRALLEIINDILDLSKIEAGKMELNPEKTDLQKLVRNATTIVNLKADERKNKLFYTIDPEVPGFISIDPVRLKQILINLLSNAAKFTKNGEIELSCKLSKKDEQNKSCTLEFSVRDTGIGIKEINRKKILEPFSQEDYTITKRYGGTGLGLAIIKSLLSKMDSQLRIESEYGEGSVFSFPLNVRYLDEPISFSKKSPEVQKKKTKGIKSKKRILIIEDNDVNMRVAEKLVGVISEETSVLKAENGEKAIELFKTSKPDIILLDLRLPDITGYEVSKRIRHLDQKVPIIAITAMVVKGEKERCLSEGMNHYLSKPLDSDKLREIIQGYL